MDGWMDVVLRLLGFILGLKCEEKTEKQTSTAPPLATRESPPAVACVGIEVYYLL